MEFLRKTKIITLVGLLFWILGCFLPFLKASYGGFSESANMLQIDSNVGVILFIIMILAILLELIISFKDLIAKLVPPLDSIIQKINSKFGLSSVGLVIYVIIRLIIVRGNTVKEMGIYGSMIDVNFTIGFYFLIVGCILVSINVFLDKKTISSNNNVNSFNNSMFNQPINNQSNFGQPMNNQSSFGQTMNNQNNFGQPMNNQNNFGQPTNNQNSFGQTMNNQNSFGQPMNNQNNFGQPMNNQNSFGQPMNNQNSFGQPMNNQNNFGQPTNNQQTYNPYNNSNNNGF